MLSANLLLSGRIARIFSALIQVLKVLLPSLRDCVLSFIKCSDGSWEGGGVFFFSLTMFFSSPSLPRGHFFGLAFSFGVCGMHACVCMCTHV